MATSKSEQSRVDFRVPASVKARFLEAAAYETGGDLSAFLIAAALERADRVLAQREVLQIDDTTRERFYSAMLAPPLPSETLRRFIAEEDARFRIVE
jgi:uncharacterized protein (DUF1778 family)